MKAFFNCLKLSFLILGAILGAGFISGKELITFFNVDGFIVPFVFSCVLFFVVIAFLFYNAEKKDNIKNQKLFDIAMYLASFIVGVCSLSGIEELLSEEIYNFHFPVYSFVILFFAFIICFKGLKGVEIVNLVIVPILIVITLVIIFKKKEFFYQKETIKKGRYINAVLYVFLNIFSNIKIIFLSAKGNNKISKIVSAIIISVVIFLLGLSILLSLTQVTNVNNFEIPILLLTSNKFEHFLMDISLFFAMFSSLIADICPLCELTKKVKDKRFYLIFLFLLILTCSMLGITKIIKYLYPIVGAFGLVFFILSIKNSAQCIIEKRGARWLKKKKLKN